MDSARSALVIAFVLGTLAALAPGCTIRPATQRCSQDTCSGCCDDLGECVDGLSDEACGATGESCGVCTAARRCQPLGRVGGRCGLGDAGAAGGTGGNTGGGGAAGGGAGGATGGGTGTDAGACDAVSCPNGCCSPSGVCITQATPSRCGLGGLACVSCLMGNTCVAGACAPCAGCIDITTGQ